MNKCTDSFLPHLPNTQQSALLKRITHRGIIQYNVNLVQTCHTLIKWPFPHYVFP